MDRSRALKPAKAQLTLKEVIMKEYGILYEPLTGADLKNLIDAVQDTFPEKEPMSRALGLSKPDYLPYTDLVCAKAIEDELSWVARSMGSDRIIGFCINEDFCDAPVYSKEKINSKMVPLLELLEKLDHEYKNGLPAGHGKLFHLYMLGVAQEYAGFGIGTELVRRSLVLAKKRRFQRAVVEATGSASQRICSKLDFTERAAIEYKSFQFKGECVFHGISGVSHCRLMDREL